MVSFGELLLIALVALLIIGPRRLPETVRFIALQMGRLRQAITQTRKTVEDELGLDEIRRQLHNEQVMRNLQATREEIERVGKGLPPKAPVQPEIAPPEETATQAVADNSRDTDTFIAADAENTAAAQPQPHDTSTS